MHINTQTCFFPDLTNLFTIVDITAEVDRRLPEIPARLHQFKTVLAESLEPTLAIGKHCDTPNLCPFTADCWKAVPDFSIFTIPRLDWKKKDALIAQEILAIADLPPVSLSRSINAPTSIASSAVNLLWIQERSRPASLNSPILSISSTSRPKTQQFPDSSV